MNSHFHAGHLSGEFYRSIDKIEFVVVEDESTMDALEIYLINKLKPKQNTTHTDGEFKNSNIFEWYNKQEWIEFKNFWNS